MSDPRVVETQTKWTVELPLTLVKLSQLLDQMNDVDWYPNIITGIEYRLSGGPLLITTRAPIGNER